MENWLTHDGIILRKHADVAERNAAAVAVVKFHVYFVLERQVPVACQKLKKKMLPLVRPSGHRWR